MNKTLIGYAVAAVLVLGMIGGYVGSLIGRTSDLGGDFAGGQLPSQLLTGSVAGGYVNPVGSFGKRPVKNRLCPPP